jgi:hypothetical protein
METGIRVSFGYPIIAHPPQAATLGWGRGFQDTYGQNVTIGPPAVFEPVGPSAWARGGGVQRGGPGTDQK